VKERRDEAARARALYADGLAAFREGDQRTSKTKNEAALELARESGDLEAEALALVGLSRVALREGDYAGVCTLASRARERVEGESRALDAGPLHMLAAGTRLMGRYDAARDLYAESLELNREMRNDYGIGMELHNLGFVELHRGNPSEAEHLFNEAATLSGDAPYDLAMGDLERGALAAVQGDRSTAAELLATAEKRLRDAGIVLDPDDAFELAWVRDALGEPA
jgi:tetratricopeptide (TPR) repeat protein